MHAAIVNRDPERAKCCTICGRPIRFGGARAICLACHLKAGLEDPDDQPVPATDPVSPSPGDTPRFFGDYELVRELGRGGMGIVHEARQFGTRRSVALKRLATGALASREAVHRFHTEAQAAALLEHPNIVPIYEVGLHDGQYFLAMRYLAGGTLADLAHGGVLPPRRAAELLRTIALAVHHAHTRGVLHRDLKPGNILLDEAGEPYVSDFGLARITAVDERFTLSTSLLGTAAYLPPEQIRGGPNAGTMAGDIYGLGAILYELLTGQPPFTGSSVADILRKVQEEHPVLRRSENRGQRSEVRGQKSGAWSAIGSSSDLETICLKCLEKEPAKRYATAHALADDLKRFLNHEPIFARPVTHLERSLRWCRRKPALAVSSLLIVILLLLVILGSPIAAYRINEARRQAAEEADTARAMLAFLRDDLLSVADPFAGNTERPRGRNLTLLAAVDLAARNVHQRFPDQPLVEAGIRVTLWQVYFALGDLDQAEDHIQRAFDLYDGADAPELQRLKALESMAWMHHARGRYAEANALIEPTLERRIRLQGADHPDVLSAQRCRLAILTSSSGHPEAIALGEDLLVRARQLPPEHTEVLLHIMGDVSWISYVQGDFPRCHALSEEALGIARGRLGDEHALTVSLMSSWAIWLRLHLGRFQEAASLQQEAYDRTREILGETHELALDSLSELALLAWANGLFGKRSEIQERLVLLAQQAHGPDSTSAIFEQMRLAGVRLNEGRLEDADALLVQALDRLRETRGSDDFLARRAMRWLSAVHIAQGRYREAVAIREEVLERERRVMGLAASRTHFETYHLANLHARLGQWPESADLFRTFLPLWDPTRQRGRERDSLHPAGFVTACLAGDSITAREIAALALNRAEQTEDWQTRYEIALSLLLAPQFVTETPHLMALASVMSEDTPDSPRKDLLAAVLAFRRNEFERSATLMASVADASPSGGLAFAFLSMANHRLGIATAADELHRARECLDRLTRAGDLRHSTFYPEEEWLPAAMLILACREAEILVYGQPIQPQFDEFTMANARERWLPVKTLLDETDRAASRGDWPAALEHFLAAIHHEYFDSSAAAQSREHFAAKAIALLALGGNLTTHPEFSTRILYSDHGAGSLSGRTFLLFQDEPLPPTTLESHVTAARAAARNRQGSDGGNPWWSLELGLAELRAGNPQAALNALEPAAAAYNLRCAAAAHALASLALWQLGEPDLARRRLAQAQDASRQLTDGNRQSLGDAWHEIIAVDRVLQKATQVLGEGDP